MKRALRAFLRAIWDGTAPVRRPLVDRFDRHLTRLIEAEVRGLVPHLDRIAARGDAAAGSLDRVELLTHAIARAVGTLEHIARATDGSLGRVEDLTRAVARAVGTLEHIARGTDGSLGRVEDLTRAIARAAGTLEHIARATDGTAGRTEQQVQALHQKADQFGGELNLVLDSLVREVARLEMQVEALQYPAPEDARDGLDLGDAAPDGATRHPQEWMKVVG